MIGRGRALGDEWGSERSSKPNDGARRADRAVGHHRRSDGVGLAAGVSGAGVVVFAIRLRRGYSGMKQKKSPAGARDGWITPLPVRRQARAAGVRRAEAW